MSMQVRWVFGRKIAVSMAALVVLTAAVAMLSILAMNSVVSAKDRVIHVDTAKRVAAEQLTASADRKSAASRGFLLTGEQKFLDQANESRDTFRRRLGELDALADPEARPLIRAIEAAEAHHQAAHEEVVQLRRTNADLDAVSEHFETTAVPRREQLSRVIADYVSRETGRQAQAVAVSNEDATRAVWLIVAIAATAVVAAVVLAIFLTRSLRRQIGRTVGDVRSSSAELQSTATQQATGAKQQATAMSEITTTINELLATSRQISESSQRVAGVAEQTAGAGRAGLDTVDRAQRSMEEIRHQVDLIVKHMLELGEKSQEIGAVLDMVSELAEQTNILAINSTIEAAGAGEAGKRFAVVADEIRKLADRVADSTKEIRALIDVVRGSVNTTVMATEIGSKAVDAGTRQFGDVATSFRAITDLVTTTTEAAREIELSTKQQTTAVEQVNVAISDVAQASRESEAGTTQTARTAAELSSLSRDLLLLVDASARG